MTSEERAHLEKKVDAAFLIVFELMMAQKGLWWRRREVLRGLACMLGLGLIASATMGLAVGAVLWLTGAIPAVCFLRFYKKERSRLEGKRGEWWAELNELWSLLWRDNRGLAGSAG
jgi:hypothetical protein